MSTVLLSVRRVASRQAGLITRRQALECGFTDARVSRWVQRGWLERVHRGVFRLPGAEETFVQRALAACLRCGPRSVASHGTAGSLLGLVDEHPGPLHVTVPEQDRPASNGILVHRTRLLRPHERGRVGPCPITSAPRTLLALAAMLPAPRLTGAVDTALRDGLTTADRLLTYMSTPSVARLRGAGTRQGRL